MDSKETTRMFLHIHNITYDVFSKSILVGFDESYTVRKFHEMKSNPVRFYLESDESIKENILRSWRRVPYQFSTFSTDPENPIHPIVFTSEDVRSKQKNIFVCPKCGTMHNSEDASMLCCNSIGKVLCKSCGTTDSRRGHVHHTRECVEQSILERASEVDLEDCTVGFVFNDKYFDHLESLYEEISDQYDNEHDVEDTWVHPAKKTQPRQISDFVDTAMEPYFDDNGECLLPESCYEELMDAVIGWQRKWNDCLHMFEEDTHRKVLIKKEWING